METENDRVTRQWNGDDDETAVRSRYLEYSYCNRTKQIAMIKPFYDPF